MNNNPETPFPDIIDVAGIRCHVYETTALEAWFAMNGFRQVIGADDPPALSGTLAHVVTQPLEPKEVDFILQQSAAGNFPSLDKFLEIHGIVGVTDFHVEASTDLPGWDGEGVAVILTNPRWYLGGELVPVPQPVAMPESRSERPRRPPRHSRHKGRR